METPSSTPTQAWAAIATAIAGALAVTAKKYLRRKQPQPTAKKVPTITHSELQQGLATMRDRITAGYMAMAEKMEANHKELVTAIAQHGSAIEKRLDALESAVARLDERTKWGKSRKQKAES